MARINVDEKWFAKDPRRRCFIKAVGNEFEADGIALHFWLLGQEAHAQGKLVNKKKFMQMPFAKEFITCQMAEERDEGIYIKGSKRRAEFLRARVEGAKKGGSKKSTAKAQAAKKREERKKTQRTAARENTAESTRKPQAPTSTHDPHAHSHSHVHSQDNFHLEIQADVAANAAHPPGDGPAHPLFILWNQHRGTLPEARSCAGSRLKKTQLRWKEQPPAEWQKTIIRMAASDFCKGKNNHAWRADFDFLIKPDTWAKVNEGKYDNNKGFKHTAQTLKYDKLDEIEQQWQDRGPK